MSKHTPGHWEAVQPIAIDYRAMQIQTDESLIAVCCGGGPKRAIYAPEERANARLIAAAPDLLEALKRCVREMRGSVSFTHEHDDALEAAHAAIAKAESEPVK